MIGRLLFWTVEIVGLAGASLAAVALCRMLGLLPGLLLAVPVSLLVGFGLSSVQHHRHQHEPTWPLTRRGVLRLMLAHERAARQRAETDARTYRSMWLTARRGAVAQRVLEQPMRRGEA